MARKARATDDIPEMTAADFKRARSLKSDMPDVAEALKRGPGRPALGAQAKERVSLRLDPEVVQAYKATGEGWQARINDVLARHKPRARKVSVA
jgi:uncharacterized protein (DUF4415 family)